MENSVYVVCGGAKEKGLGIAVTEQLAKGGKVVMTGATPKEVDEGLAYLEEKNIKNATALVCEISKEEDIQNLVKLSAAAGKVIGLVIVAGLTPLCGDWKKIFAVDLIGHINMMKAFQPIMESGSAIVSFGSSAAYMLTTEAVDAAKDVLYGADENTLDKFLVKVEPFVCGRGLEMAANMAYSFAKKGIILQAQKQAVLLGAHGIRVNTVSPGIADTENNSLEYERSSKSVDQRMYKMVNNMTPSKRMATRQEIATVVDFLLSANASFVSGIDILVDGGCLGHMRMLKQIA
jgi:NAD(P)-dependent dehydrogenase (short-subunit alcohol dehydrogenase family)